jgi:hypothetical protein
MWFEQLVGQCLVIPWCRTCLGHTSRIRPLKKTLRFEKSLDMIFYAVENGKKRLVLPQGKLRQALLYGAHDALVAGHLCFKKAYEHLRRGVTLPEMYSELKAYIRSCDSFQRNKTSNQKPIGLLKPLEILTERF